MRNTYGYIHYTYMKYDTTALLFHISIIPIHNVKHRVCVYIIGYGRICIHTCRAPMAADWKRKSVLKS